MVSTSNGTITPPDQSAATLIHTTGHDRPGVSRSRRGRRTLRARGLVHAEAGVTLGFELLGEVGAARLSDASVEEDVHLVGVDVAQDARVVRDEQCADTSGPHLVDALADDPQRIDVEAGIGL